MYRTLITPNPNVKNFGTAWNNGRLANIRSRQRTAHRPGVTHDFDFEGYSIEFVCRLPT